MNEYAVIGWPLGHSMSPLIHNASFRALGLACRLEAHPLSPAQFPGFMASLPAARLKGLAVTIPYKTDVLGYCGFRAPEVAAIGAANTLRVAGRGVIEAFNTDAAGAGRSLREAGVTVTGSRAVVIGAGGAARAVCARLVSEGVASLTIANRTLPRAERLRDELRRATLSSACITAIPLGGEEIRHALRDGDLLVNTSSVGMYPHADESPLPGELLKRDLAVMDIVYNPVETRLLEEARAAGARTIPGTEMFLYQAVEQERIWLGVDAPVTVMRDALFSGLGRVP